MYYNCTQWYFHSTEMITTQLGKVTRNMNRQTYSFSLNSRLSIWPPTWLIIRCICDTSKTYVFVHYSIQSSIHNQLHKQSRQISNAARLWHITIMLIPYPVLNAQFAQCIDQMRNHKLNNSTSCMERKLFSSKFC